MVNRTLPSTKQELGNVLVRRPSAFVRKSIVRSEEQVAECVARRRQVSRRWARWCGRSCSRWQRWQRARRLRSRLLAGSWSRCAAASTTRVVRSRIASTRSGQRAGRPRRSRQVPAPRRTSGRPAGSGGCARCGRPQAWHVRRRARSARGRSVRASAADRAGGARGGSAWLTKTRSPAWSRNSSASRT